MTKRVYVNLKFHLNYNNTFKLHFHFLDFFSYFFSYNNSESKQNVTLGNKNLWKNARSILNLSIFYK